MCLIPCSGTGLQLPAVADAGRQSWCVGATIHVVHLVESLTPSSGLAHPWLLHVEEWMSRWDDLITKQNNTTKKICRSYRSIGSRVCMSLLLTLLFFLFFFLFKCSKNICYFSSNDSKYLHFWFLWYYSSDSVVWYCPMYENVWGKEKWNRAVCCFFKEF